MTGGRERQARGWWACLAAAVIGGCAPARPVIEVLSCPYDFGEGWPGEVREATLRVYNRGDAPLELGLGQKSCSCLAAELRPDRIAPGDEGAIHLRVRVPFGRAQISGWVVLHTNDPDRREVTLRFVVRRRFAVQSPKKIVLDANAVDTHTVRLSVPLYPVEGVTVRNVRVENCTVIGVDATVSGPPWTLHFEANAARLVGPSTGHVELVLNVIDEGGTSRPVPVQIPLIVKLPERRLAVPGVVVAVWKNGQLVAEQLVPAHVERRTALEVLHASSGKWHAELVPLHTSGAALLRLSTDQRVGEAKVELVLPGGEKVRIRVLVPRLSEPSVQPDEEV